MDGSLFSLTGCSDPLDAVRAFNRSDLSTWVWIHLSNTRDYELLLLHVLSCRTVINDRYEEMSPEEFYKIDADLIGYELAAYDWANRWEDYLDLFSYVNETRRYTIDYPKGNNNDEIFNEHILGEDEYTIYVHFLYRFVRTYNKVRKKYQKMVSGKNTEHLKRHQKTEPCKESLDERLNNLAQFIEKKRRFSEKRKIVGRA